jgi:hypothetical protein
MLLENSIVVGRIGVKKDKFDHDERSLTNLRVLGAPVGATLGARRSISQLTCNLFLGIPCILMKKPSYDKVQFHLPELKIMATVSVT